ncbi:MAG TPA: SIMPL domain-containing protein [Candidatus Sphingobacterium stercoripullorum]|uniref:SIMPL domain-containing protein n=1 Tax=Candidatus Sphingobacterium stercoripullorum TaxID=2838759 RepID=A0A9D2AXL4_9SPHI|nr:SIMPL domain-containing protein [Candidatus Sphingobacterium stercoripullorum]HLR49424.1 SIMPL domain-containing protein [Candidatus Sphingobacterium stercoripullorum]
MKNSIVKYAGILFLFLLTIASTAKAQIGTEGSTVLRKIATKATAEKEVTPDIIYLSVSLKEYYLGGNMKKKVEIKDLEKQLFDATSKAGIKEDDLTIQNIYSYQYNPDKKKKEVDFLQSRQYRIKVTDLSKLNQILDAVDSKGIQNTSIAEYDYSEKESVELQLKAEAFQKAKKTAQTLAQNADSQLGDALTINDNSNLSSVTFRPVAAKTMRAYSASADMDGLEENSLDIDIHPMKISVQIDVVFEIK